MSSIIKDIFEGVENTVKGAFDGDLGSIVALGAMAYGGYSLYTSLGSASTAATNIAGEGVSNSVMSGVGGAEAAAATDFLAPVSTNAGLGTGLLDGATATNTMTIGAADAGSFASADALSLGGASSASAFDSALTSVNGLLDGSINASGGFNGGGSGGGAFNGGTGSSQNSFVPGETTGSTNFGQATYDQRMTLNKMGYGDDVITKLKPEQINSIIDKGSKGLIDSPYLAPAAIIGGNVLASGISAAEQRRIEEQRIKERNQEQSGGFTRSGEGNINLNVGDRASNIAGSYRAPSNPGKYQRTA